MLIVIHCSQKRNEKPDFKTFNARAESEIIKMDSKQIGNGKPGDITKKMMEMYTEIVMNKNDDYSHWLTEVY